MSIELRTYEIGVATFHEVRAMNRKLDDMGRRRSRGWKAKLPDARLIPWMVALGLAMAGHFTVSDLKGMVGIRPIHSPTDSLR